MNKELPHTPDQPLDLATTALTVLLCAIWGVAYSWLFLQGTLGPVQLLDILGVCLGVYIVNSGGAFRPRTLASSEVLRAQQQGQVIRGDGLQQGVGRGHRHHAP